MRELNYRIRVLCFTVPIKPTGTAAEAMNKTNAAAWKNVARAHAREMTGGNCGTATLLEVFFFKTKTF